MSKGEKLGSVFTTGLSVPAGTPLLGKSGLTGRIYDRAMKAITRHSAQYAASLVGRGAAPDVAQEVAMVVDERVQADNSYPDATTPLRKIVRDLTRELAERYRKQNWRRRCAEGVHAEERAENVRLTLDTERAALEADMEKVRQTIEARLTAATYETFRLSRDDELSYEEISGVQGTPRSRVKKRMVKALFVCREVCRELDLPVPPPLGKAQFKYPSGGKKPRNDANPDHDPASGGAR